MATFPATLFDYNGVLVDDEAVHLAAFRETLSPLGIEVTDETYWSELVGLDDRSAFASVLTTAGRDAASDTIDGLVAKKAPRYRQRASAELQEFAGATALVRRRATLGPVAIVSGAARDEIDLGVRRLGIQDCLVGVVAREQTARSKPSPEGYLSGVALLSLHASPEVARDAVVVEDSLAGIQAAKAAGLACVAVAHSFDEDRLRRSEADAVFASVADLTDAALADAYARIHA